MNGKEMHKALSDLYPICRSITGEGVRTTLEYIKAKINNLNIYSVPTGTKVFDWTVPQEWNITDAYITDESKTKIIDFRENNLHVMSYSIPVNKWLTLEELDNHLYSLPSQPNAIPYVTSYYSKNWGFCLACN